MDVRKLTLAFSTTDSFADEFNEIQDLRDQCNELRDIKENVVFFPLNPGLMNIIKDNMSILDDIEKMKPVLGANLSRNIKDAYRKYNDSINYCKILEIPILDGKRHKFMRNKFTGKTKQTVTHGNQYRSILPILMRRMLITDNDFIESDKVIAFQQAAAVIFKNTYADRFQYANDRYSTQMNIFANSSAYGKNSLFWEYKDDDSHQMMSLVHILNLSFTSALTMAVTNTSLTNYDRAGGPSALRSVLKEYFNKMLSIKITPSMYALFAYIWMSSGNDVDAGASISMILWDREYDSFKDIILDVCHPSASEEAVKDWEDEEISTCTIEDGYASYTTAVVCDKSIEKLNSVDLGVIKMEIEFENFTLREYEKYTIKPGKSMTILDLTNENCFAQIEVNNFDSFVLRRSRSDVTVWLRIFASYYDGCKNGNKQDMHKWMKTISKDVYPWMVISTSSRAKDDVFVKLMSDMVNFENAGKIKIIEGLLTKMLQYVYSFNYEAKSNMMFVIARAC